MTDDEPFFRWNDDMSVKSEELDYQHRHMVEILNYVYQAFNNGEHKEIIGPVIDELSQYAIYHFTMEEVYFEMFDYYDKENHIREHKLFRQKVEEFISSYKTNEAALTKDVLSFLRNWFSDHIIESDQKYVDCFVKHGVK